MKPSHVFVVDRRGSSRACSTGSRRSSGAAAFNIESLTVGHTEQARHLAHDDRRRCTDDAGAQRSRRICTSW